MSTATHIAGPVITGYFQGKGRAIQRCACCGELLIDSWGMMGPLDDNGEPPELGTWEVGGLVQIEGNRSSLVPRGDEQPEDFCMELVEP